MRYKLIRLISILTVMAMAIQPCSGNCLRQRAYAEREIHKMLATNLAASPDDMEEILSRLPADGREATIDMAIAMLREQIVVEPKATFTTHLNNYLTMLKILRIKGILKGLIVYPFIGIDIFPALFEDVLGVNNRYELEKLYQDIAENPGVYCNMTKTDLSIISSRLSYQNADALNIGSMIRLIAGAGSGYKSTTLLLKGLSFARNYTGANNSNKFFGESYRKIFVEYLLPLCGRILKTGDHIVLFNSDVTAFKDFLLATGEYEEVELGINIDTTIDIRISHASRQPYIRNLGLSKDVLEAGVFCVALRKVNRVDKISLPMGAEDFALTQI